jgi:hypothetical protein
MDSTTLNTLYWPIKEYFFSCIYSGIFYLSNEQTNEYVTDEKNTCN